MRSVFSRFLFLFFVLFLTGACSHGNDVIRQDENPTERHGTESNRVMGESCTRSEAEKFTLKARENPLAALEAAVCYAFLARQGENRAEKLADAKEGRKMAEAAMKSFPENATAHYLMAYLTGLEAENDPARGLELVPVIEREALTAGHLNPNIDNGGPDRMLGELYLRAPSFPMSVGDVEKAMTHFRKAVKLAPNFLQNRVGLLEALVENEDPSEACLEIEKIFVRMPPEEEMTEEWKRSLKLLKRMCGMWGDK
ncbi:MAG TPA: hypothetical protein HPP90_03050 [Deltaproteobacteria bacterium]|nr:hypothetical protein [Deltaproteobacteria bacterium]